MGRISPGKNCLPGSIRSLLKLLIGKKVTLILKIESGPSHVEIEDVVGNLVIVEKDSCFKFIDIDCVCEVIVGCNELLEAILGSDKNTATISADICETGITTTSEPSKSEEISVFTSNTSWHMPCSHKPKHRQLRC